ncbi:MAG: hypothetical protein AAGE94_07090 [Acidobacteriota bacterium]
MSGARQNDRGVEVAADGGRDVSERIGPAAGGIEVGVEEGVAAGALLGEDGARGQLDLQPVGAAGDAVSRVRSSLRARHWD